jgi:hypothetical protein
LGGAATTGCDADALAGAAALAPALPGFDISACMNSSSSWQLSASCFVAVDRIMPSNMSVTKRLYIPRYEERKK